MSIKTIYVQAGGGLDKIEKASSQSRKPEAGEITVRLYASSLNYHDLMVVTGAMPPQERRIPMSDGAGEVIAVGEGVSEFSIGDHVVSTFFPDWLDGEAQLAGFSRVPGDGIDGYAREQVTAPATALTLAPEGYSHAEAATLTTAGARVIATSSSDAKLERLSALGADEVINYRKDPQWGETARRMTNGRGVDHVIEVGGAGTLAQSIQASKVGGHIAIIGVLSGVESQLSIVQALASQLRLQCFLVGNRRQQQDFIRAIDVMGLRPVIDRHFPLESIVEAFEYQTSGQHFGKIVFDI